MKVLVIDDHTLFVTGLGALLEQHGIQVAATGVGQEGIELIPELEPDVVLLDLRMPGMNGLEVLRALRDAENKVPVVMLTTSEEEADLLEAFRLGAQGYLLKDMDPDELVGALRRAQQGETVIAPRLTSALARAAQGETRAVPGRMELEELLTPREFEILQHLAEGQSNKVIARELGISDGTVKLHVKSILRKLNVHSRVEAAVIAVERGLNRKPYPLS
jgi:two-component system nitrate/nitrite response regulator NarL